MSHRDWYSGMKVVCVDNHDFEGILEVNRVYTVTSIHPGRGMFRGRYTEALCVGLAEAQNPHDDVLFIFDGQVGFCSLRFRPAQPRATDISVFEAMLNRSKVPA